MIKDILEIDTGITAVIGSGGKTSLIRRLAKEISGKTIICTMTHIMKPDDIPVFSVALAEMGSSAERNYTREKSSTRIEQNLADFLSENAGKPVCVGVTDPENPEKLVSFPIETIKRAAGEDAYILVEADGAKHLPMKAHNDNEPVISEDCKRVILVIGAEGFGRPIREVVHRPQIFAKLAKTGMDGIVTAELLSNVLLAEREKFGNGRLQVLLNRTEGEDTFGSRDGGIPRKDIENAEKLKELTGWEIYAGNISKGEIVKM